MEVNSLRSIKDSDGICIFSSDSICILLSDVICIFLINSACGTVLSREADRSHVASCMLVC